MRGRPVRLTDPGLVPAVATAFRADGSLVTVGTNGTAYVWDVAVRTETSEMAGPGGHRFGRAAFSPDGLTMAAQANGGTTDIFKAGTSPSYTLPAGERLYPGSIATAGLTIATEDTARTGADVWVGFAARPRETLIDGSGLTSVALSVDASTVAASDDRGRTYLWNANTGTRTHILRAPDSSKVNCSVFSFFGKLLVTGNRDGRAYVWNYATGALLRSVRDPNGVVDTVEIGGGGHMLATAGSGDAVYLWDAATGASLGTIRDPGGHGVTALSVNMSGSQLAVADKNGTTYVWTLGG